MFASVLLTALDKSVATFTIKSESIFVVYCRFKRSNYQYNGALLSKVLDWQLLPYLDAIYDRKTGL